MFIMKADPRKMEMNIPGSHVLTFCHNIVLSFLFLYVSLSAIPLFIQRTGCLGQAANSPRGVLNKFLYGEAPPRRSNPLPFICHFSRKRYPFCIPYIEESYPFLIPSLDLCIPFNCCKCAVF